MVDAADTVEKVPTKQLRRMVIIYFVCNVAGLAFILFLIEPLVHAGKFELWLLFLIAVPFPFTAACVASLHLALKEGLYRQHFDVLRWTLIIQLVTATTWAFVMLFWWQNSKYFFPHAYRIVSYWLFLVTHT